MRLLGFLYCPHLHPILPANSAKIEIMKIGKNNIYGHVLGDNISVRNHSTAGETNKTAGYHHVMLNNFLA